MSPHSDDPASLRSTADLLGLVRSGDERAIRELFLLYQPFLEKWASGRLPGHARGLVDTVDVVQVCLVRVIDHIDRFDARRPGAFLAYLRRSLLNQIRNEIRAAGSRPQSGADATDQADLLPSIEEEVGQETVEAYEAALSELPEEDQAAVILRVEFGLKYQEIADALARPSANAVRMQVTRALVKMAESMGQ
ncbi:MAG: sigma-70 family RNA polymerase sigma factor [Candidatus Eisenbacteria bacterium]